MEVDIVKNELIRMKEKRNNICIELGNGYNWKIVDSLIDIDEKIRRYEKEIGDIEYRTMIKEGKFNSSK